MELCSVNLKDYINRGAVLTSDASRFLEEPVFVAGDCSPNLHILNTWTIMSHIARGLQVVHHKGYSHRDLKPENGLQPLIFILTIVLYSHTHKVWKIADFGITSTVTSRRAITTRYARGTDGFRAPELLLEPSKFTNKVDIWAMGCILYQIATCKQLFSNDHFVRDFDHMDPKLEISDALVPATACPHLSECLREILQNDSQQRPTVSFLNSLFESYCTIWDSSIVPILDEAKSFPPSSEWMRLIRGTTEGRADFLSLLVDWHQSNGRNQLVIPLLNASMKNFPKALRLDKWAEFYERARDWDAAIVLRKCIVDSNQDDGGRQLKKILVCEIERVKEMIRRENILALYSNVATDNVGGTPMHHAAWNGDVEAIKALRDIGADVEAKDNDERTPIHYAACNGHVEAIKTLKEIGADISARGYVGAAPMQDAAKNGQVEAMKALKEMGADISAEDNAGATPMHYAAENGHVDAIRTLKEMGANISAKAKDDVGRTPMHYAAKNGHVEAIKSLGEMGADISAKDDNIKWTPMHYAAKYGHVEAIKTLKEMGADVSAKDNNTKWTPMHYAAKYGHVEAIKTLKQMGADISAQDYAGATPMHYAAENGHVEAINALGDMGADTSVKDYVGSTPMHHAARNGHAEAINALGVMGADASVKDYAGSTPLHHAARNGHAEAINALGDMGADVSAKDGDKETPLHYAAWNGHIGAIRALRAMKANVSVKGIIRYI